MLLPGFGRKRKRESSVEIEYVIINKFRSHNWKYYKPLIVGRPSVDVYDMLSHPVLKSAVTGKKNNNCKVLIELCQTFSVSPSVC